MNIPTAYLPLFLNNFDLLDCQGPAEKPRENVIFRPKLVNNISTEQILGYQGNDWVTSTDDDFENISTKINSYTNTKISALSVLKYAVAP